MKEEKVRICRLCSEIKPIEDFEKDTRIKHHHTNRCKACKSKTQDKAARAYQHLRERSAKLGVEVEATVEEIKALYAMFEGLCIYCGEKETDDGPTWHLDHIRPLSQGGTNHASNLAIACPSCNLRKNKKTVVTHFFEDEKFRDINFVVLVHYIAYKSGQPAQEIRTDLINEHADFEVKRI